MKPLPSWCAQAAPISPNLNTAHFYIRTDEKGVFEAILEDVRAKLARDTPEITLTVRRETHGGNRPYRPALKERSVPTASIDSTHAKPVINKIIKATQDYSAGGVNTVGGGGRIQILQTIGIGEAATVEWTEVEHSNRVTARWILRREVQRLFPSHGDRQRSPVNLCDIEDPKFDALVEYNSPAADHIRNQARKVVDAYIEHSVILQNALKTGKTTVLTGEQARELLDSIDISTVVGPPRSGVDFGDDLRLCPHRRGRRHARRGLLSQGQALVGPPA